MSKRILRPLGFGELFDEVFDLYKQHFLLFVGIAAVTTLPTNMLQYGLGHDFISAWWFAIPVLQCVELFAFTWAVSQCYLGEPASVLGAFGAVTPKLFGFLLTILLVYLCWLGGTMLCVIPGVIVAFWSVFVAPVLVLENRLYLDASKRSRQLAAGQWGRIFLVLISALALAVIAGYAVRMPFEWIAKGAPHFPGRIGGTWSMVGVLIAGTLTSPILTMAVVLLYYDTRVRKEGFDIQMLAENMGRTSGKAGAPSP